MSTVNKYNYEAVLLDFAEGRLSAKETDDLFDFLAAHPGLQEDFDAALEMISLDNTAEFSFSKKNDLIKDETSDFQQLLIIAHVEGVASQAEGEKLQALQTSNPALAQEVIVFAKLKMLADEQIVFSRKNKLLQENTLRFSVWLHRTTYAAAAVLLLFLIDRAFNQSPKVDFTELAQEKINLLIQNENKNTTPILQQEEPLYTEKINTPTLGHTSTKKQQIATVNKIESKNSMVKSDRERSNEIEVFQHMPIHEALAIDNPMKSKLAETPRHDPETAQKTEPKQQSGFIDYLAEQSSIIQSSYGFAGELSGKLKSFSGDFQKVDEIELKVWGMRTTIHKPSWMKWRRQKVKSE